MRTIRDRIDLLIFLLITNLWERACSRRCRCSRYISGGWNAVFVSKVERHPGHSHMGCVCCPTAV